MTQTKQLSDLLPVPATKPSIWNYLSTPTIDISNYATSSKNIWSLITTTPKDVTELLLTSTGNKIDFWSYMTIVKKKPTDLIDTSTGLSIANSTTITNTSLPVTGTVGVSSVSGIVSVQGTDNGDLPVYMQLKRGMGSSGTNPLFSRISKIGTVTAGFAGGGYISGAGGPTSDMIPAMLSNGEYVVRASAVSSYGKGMLDSINSRKFATGGLARKYAIGGAVETGNNSSFSDNSVYNINVTANTNANADDIANTVIKAIQRQQSSLTTSRNMGSMR